MDGILHYWMNYLMIDGLIDTYNKTLPAVNTIEKENQYLLEIAVPGMDKKDFQIEIDDDLITVS